MEPVLSSFCGLLMPMLLIPCLLSILENLQVECEDPGKMLLPTLHLRPHQPTDLPSRTLITSHFTSRKPFYSFLCIAQHWTLLFELAFQTLHIGAQWALLALRPIIPPYSSQTALLSWFPVALFTQNSLPSRTQLAKSSPEAIISMKAFLVHSADNRSFPPGHSVDYRAGSAPRGPHCPGS